MACSMIPNSASACTTHEQIKFGKSAYRMIESPFSLTYHKYVKARAYLLEICIAATWAAAIIWTKPNDMQNYTGKCTGNCQNL